MASEKRAILNLTADQYDLLKEAADKLGQSVPNYCRSVSLGAAIEFNAKTKERNAS